MTRIVLADDHILVRDGIKSILLHEPDLEVVSEATDGIEAYEAVIKYQPELLIIDIRMPNQNGIETIERLNKENINVKRIILSMHDSDEYVINAIRAGADGYLLKGANKEEFLKAIRRVMQGEKYFSGDISSVLIHKISQQNNTTTHENIINKDFSITKRELQILVAVLEGKSNKEIAEILDISRRTIEAHRFNLMKKLNAKNLIELSHKAKELKLFGN